MNKTTFIKKDIEKPVSVFDIDINTITVGTPTPPNSTPIVTGGTPGGTYPDTGI